MNRKPVKLADSLGNWVEPGKKPGLRADFAKNHKNRSNQPIYDGTDRFMVKPTSSVINRSVHCQCCDGQ